MNSASEKVRENTLYDVKNNPLRRELFIKENISFIASCASQVAGHFVDRDDDLFSESLSAFNDSINSFDDSKGYFYAYAKVCIQNKIKDYFKKQNRHNSVIPFSSLSSANDRGEEIAFEVEDVGAGMSETALEIYSLKEELKQFGIVFTNLPSAAPKLSRTRKACVKAARYVVENKKLLDSLYRKKCLPSTQILSELKLNKKITERYRPYIIMGILILNGNYEILAEYFDPYIGR